MQRVAFVLGGGCCKMHELASTSRCSGEMSVCCARVLLYVQSHVVGRDV